MSWSPGFIDVGRKYPRGDLFRLSMKEPGPSLAETRYQLDTSDVNRSKAAFVPAEPLQTRHSYSLKGEIVVAPDRHSVLVINLPSLSLHEQRLWLRGSPPTAVHPWGLSRTPPWTTRGSTNKEGRK